MTISLIISTYNWREALELVLVSILRQTKLPDQVIVADDGSSDGTAELVQKISDTAEIEILHSWQEDKGFRAAKSRNRAMAKTHGDYIILVDGDCILEKHFVEDHANNAENGCFVQGSRVLLKARKSKELLQSKRTGVSVFGAGIENRKNCIRSLLVSSIFTRKNNGMKGVRTCNFAFWKKDAIAVNGFNEDFVGWGREDSEFAARLMNQGVQRTNLRFMAILFHLFHKQNARTSLSKNDVLLQNTIKNRLTWCENGLNKYS